MAMEGSFPAFSTRKRGRGAPPACGRAQHGKPSGGLALCFACGRAGSRDGAPGQWRHVGRGEYWADLDQWVSEVGEGWQHERDLVNEPLTQADCLCFRTDCVFNLYCNFKLQLAKRHKGSGSTLQPGQRAHMGRYPSTPTQVGALLAHVRVTGGVLDACGSTIDAVSSVLKSHDLHVTTNDFNRGLAADTHLDAGSERFVEAYGKGAMQPDWVVTSPPYSKAFDILVQTLRVARVGVAMKLRLTFLEPTKGRGKWLAENPPGTVVVLPRATYRGRECVFTEAWIVWYRGSHDKVPRKQAFFFTVNDGGK